MKLQWNRSLRISVCTAAMLAAGWVQAQTPAQPEHPAPVPAAQAPQPHHPGHAHPHHGKKSEHHKHHSKHHKSNSGKYATPGQHEAAAVGQERRKGVGPANPDAQRMNDFERNAFRRCEIFKTNEDRMACVERVRQPKVSGSVSGGGVLREYTQTIQVPPPAQTAPPAQYAPAPAPHPHMVHPPVQPMRNP